MRFMDRLLQKWRIKIASPWAPLNGTILDIGCHQGELLDSLGNSIKQSFGYDPTYLASNKNLRHVFFSEQFKENPNLHNFIDAVFLLAVLEHVDDKLSLISGITKTLKKNGIVVLTIPEKKTDHIINFLISIRVLDGMAIEEHHGFNPKLTRPLFENNGYSLIFHKKFQLGFNNLFVFKKN